MTYEVQTQEKNFITCLTGTGKYISHYKKHKYHCSGLALNLFLSWHNLRLHLYSASSMSHISMEKLYGFPVLDDFTSSLKATVLFKFGPKQLFENHLSMGKGNLSLLLYIAFYEFKFLIILLL